ncbi:unnamed protein product [Musa hybrid cultivar]
MSSAAGPTRSPPTTWVSSRRGSTGTRWGSGSATPTRCSFNHLKFTVLVHKFEDAHVAKVTTTGDASEAILEKVESELPGWMVVGFEVVVPCSFRHGAESVTNLKMYDKYPAKIQCDPTKVTMTAEENQPIVFTYEVAFVESYIEWPSRRDAYLKMEGAKVHSLVLDPQFANGDRFSLPVSVS